MHKAEDVTTMREALENTLIFIPARMLETRALIEDVLETYVDPSLGSNRECDNLCDLIDIIVEG